MQLKIAERTLSNGFALLALQNEGVHTFAATVSLDVDVRDETDGQHGVANMVGDCLDEGTKNRTGVELALAVDEIGARLSGNASGGTVLGPARQMAPALELLRETVFEPAFHERDVHRVRDEVLQEIEVDEADPRTVASHRYAQEVYGAHPYSRPVYGDAKSVAAMEPASLEAFHRQWFQPHAGYVAAAGPGPVEETLDQLAAVFESVQGDAVEHHRPAAPPMPAPGIDIHLPMEREQVHVFVGHPGIRRMDPDFYALSVMDHVLGTGPGFTSRVSRRLRDEMGLCYSVHAAITSSAGEEPGCFTAYIGTKAEHREKSIEGFFHEIDLLRTELVSEKELSDVQEYLTGSYVFAFERNTQLARYAIRSKRFGFGFDHIEKYPGLIRAVTREDVLRVAQKHLQPQHMVRVSAGASTAG